MLSFLLHLLLSFHYQNPLSQHLILDGIFHFTWNTDHYAFFFLYFFSISWCNFIKRIDFDSLQTNLQILCPNLAFGKSYLENELACQLKSVSEIFINLNLLRLIIRKEISTTNLFVVIVTNLFLFISYCLFSALLSLF